MIMKAKSLILILCAVGLLVLTIVRVTSATTSSEILFGGFLAIMFAGYIIIAMFENLSFFKVQKLWLNSKRRLLDYGFMFLTVLVFEILFLNFEPASGWHQIVRIVSMIIFGIAGILITYRLLRE